MSQLNYTSTYLLVGALYQIFLLGADLWACPLSCCSNLQADLCPSANHELSRAGLCWRHIWFFPPKPPHFLEQERKFDLPDAGTVHTAAAVFPTYLKGGHVLQSQLHGCHQTRASREWHRQCLQQEAELKGDTSACPKRQELSYPLFSSFLCWWVLALFKGNASMGSTSRSLRALGCRDGEGFTMARHSYLRGCPCFCMRLSLVPAISGLKQSEPLFLTETEGGYLAKRSLSEA